MKAKASVSRNGVKVSRTTVEKQKMIRALYKIVRDSRRFPQNYVKQWHLPGGGE